MNEEIIIQKALELIKADFMSYPDFDDTVEFGFKDAVTILLSEHFPDTDTCIIYDFLCTKIS